MNEFEVYEMVEQRDFVDITPRGVDDGQGVKGLNNTVFQESDLVQIRENPDRLTKEGIEEKIKLWKMSSNKHTVIKYNTMLKQCRNIAPSGVLEDERIIFSRDVKGNPKWVSSLAPTEPILKEKGKKPVVEKKPEKPVDKKPEEK